MNTYSRDPSSPSFTLETLQFNHPWPLSLPPEPAATAEEERKSRGRILIAEDDAISRELIATRLKKWGFEVVVTENGTQAMAALREQNAPPLAMLDWMMPGMDGLEICRRVREADRSLYIILLTARSSKENVVDGLGAGADDYLIKPFDKEELHARILVGMRVIDLQTSLNDRVRELEAAFAEIRVLRSEITM